MTGDPRLICTIDQLVNLNIWPILTLQEESVDDPQPMNSSSVLCRKCGRCSWPTEAQIRTGFWLIKSAAFRLRPSVCQPGPWDSGIEIVQR